jgi:hypothetical protein
LREHRDELRHVDAHVVLVCRRVAAPPSPLAPSC